MPSLRIRRVNELVKREVGEIVRRDLNTATSGLITVTDVEVAPDLKSAKIFYSVVGTPVQERNADALFARRRAHIQHEMARAVVLKYTPVLEFLRDNSLERGNRVLRILNEIEAANPEGEDAPPVEPESETSKKPSRARRPKN